MFQRVPAPELRSVHDVRIRVARAGFCRTDLHVARGRIACVPPRVLGHEVAGIVVEVGADVTRVTLGTRVAVMPLMPCGDCPGCRAHQLCLTPRMLGVDVDGGFAQAVIVPESQVFPVPLEMSFERAAYVEPVAAAMAVLRSPIQPGTRGVVVGGGRIGELTQRVLLSHGHRDFTVESVDGPRHAGVGMDWAIETTGTEAGISLSLRSLRVNGTLVLKSRPPAPVPVDVSLAVRREISIHAVGYAPATDAIRLLGQAGFAVDDLFSDCHPLRAYAEVFAQAEHNEHGKVFFAPCPELA